MASQKTREELELELNERLRFVKKYCITHAEVRQQNKRIENLQMFLSDLDMKKIVKSRPPKTPIKQKTHEDEEREKQELLKLIDSVHTPN